jgi:SAM-dependent methyltransferase
MATGSVDPQRRFAFGLNWQSFIATVTDESIAEARSGLNRLFPDGELQGRSLLDIGCGSGLSMLAAAQLGARPVYGVDIDANSVAATGALLSRHLTAGDWTARPADVFDLDPGAEGMFDIVYSWGVLHHTGNLTGAIRKAASLVAPGGYLAIALYRRTPFCAMWRAEKRVYSGAAPPVQAALRSFYKAAYSAALIATRRSPARYRREYRSARGMDWAHDVHDWLGGYPYESVMPQEVIALLEELGFAAIRVFEKPAAARGLFGSHCDEFVARRKF